MAIRYIVFNKDREAWYKAPRSKWGDPKKWWVNDPSEATIYKTKGAALTACGSYVPIKHPKVNAAGVRVGRFSTRKWPKNLELQACTFLIGEFPIR